MKPIYKCMTKGTTAEGNQIQYGPNWVSARRGWLKIYEDHLECGDWNILNNEIITATLYSIKIKFFIPGYILKIETEKKTYHFGLNGGKFWKGDLPFEVEREKTKLEYSPISIVTRIIILVYIIYFIWQELIK